MHENSKKIYEGDFQQDEFEGWGRCFGCNGSLLYEGEMHSGRFYGYGKKFYSDGQTIMYEGNFKQGKYNGYGKLFNERQEKQYEGLFLQGLYAKEVIDSFNLMLFKYASLKEAQEKVQRSKNSLSKQDINSICEILFNRKEDIEEYDYIRMMQFLKTIY